MGIAVVKSVTKAGRQPRMKLVQHGLLLVAVVSASIGVGISIGWKIKPSPVTIEDTTTESRPASATTAGRRPSFMLIGDSLTQFGGASDGWATKLQTAYLRSIDVHNRGLSGWNTRQVRETALPILTKEVNGSTSVAFITVWLGANDAALANGPSSGQHVPLDEYKTNLIGILKTLRQLVPTAKVLLISPPVVDDDTRRSRQVNRGELSDPIDRSNEQAGIYAAACTDVAQAVDGVTLLDMYQYLMDTYPNAADRTALLSDGLHFNTNGNNVFFQQIRMQIKALLPASLLDTAQIA